MRFKNRRTHTYTPHTSLDLNPHRALLFRLFVLFNRQTIPCVAVETPRWNKKERKYHGGATTTTTSLVPREAINQQQRRRNSWDTRVSRARSRFCSKNTGQVENQRVISVRSTTLVPFPSSPCFSFVAREVGQPDTKKRRRRTWQHRELEDRNGKLSSLVLSSSCSLVG